MVGEIKIQVGDALPGGSFKVLSKFKDIVNLTNEHGHLASIASREDYLGPNTVVAKGFDLNKIDRAEVNQKGIYINHVFFCSITAKSITQPLTSMN
jgi:hypothetical protein